ncbi:hypothetical protein ACYVLC_003496 [Vibrio cholerae]|uniref:hypothetical protein n=1 Tax=Vibrio cholerae TaxID=666 RepID=UPI000BA94693|nr:hypothetical protein [Vibrio cholerae]EGQ9579744.1 hypothetical protein [Vibrio cholerae]EGR5013347.1 hypothetical protein [Vibrio cholerae]EID7717350.1 hypothetical protein [Vibrio cholerae]EJF7199301.1 hypothetical protein [Vibrio cholerae]EJL6684814.1 hypothetical protein [Vibrio cholerae]
MNQSDKISKELLEWLGYDVVIIPTSDREEKKEADFLISYGNETAIVEAKVKEDSEEVAKEKEEKLCAGEVAIVEGKLGRNETISGVIKHAKKQLRSSSDKDHDFKLISFIAIGSNTLTKSDQFKDTIYGSTLIVDPSSGDTKVCYFYRNADFFRHRIIDAAIIGYEQSSVITVYLALNPYSENYEHLKTSNFIKPFREHVIDPIEQEKQGIAYIPDADIERKLTPLAQLSPLYNPIIHHLQEKYGPSFLIPVDFDSPELSIRTECDEDE